MSLFDAYLFVDWSASSRPARKEPRKDAIWLGELLRGSIPTERYHRTRAGCADDVRDRLRVLTAEGLRVLVGFDFPYGYPRGFASALGMASGKAPWAETWSRLQRDVQEGPDNANNRWSVASKLNRSLMPQGSPTGPFWNCPASAATGTLASNRGTLAFPFLTKAGLSLDEWRHGERRARIRNPTVQSAWKLFTRGSVGSQALLGIPRVASLRHDATLAPFSSVWPFETGFRPSPVPTRGPFVLHTEVWPALFSAEVHALRAADSTLIADQAQVRALCLWAEQSDARGQLGSYFDTPSGLSHAEIQDCVSEEGWILGLT